MKIFSLFLVCNLCYGFSELNTLEKASETPLNKLRVTITKYLENKDTKSITSRLEKQLKQKQEDSNQTKENCLNQMALDFFFDEKKKLVADPKNLKEKELIRLCASAKFFFDNNGVIVGWKDHVESILKWIDFLKEK